MKPYLGEWQAGALVMVGLDDAVDPVDDLSQVLVEVLLVHLFLQYAPVQFVHHEDRADSLGDSLPQHCLRLHTHACGERGALKKIIS